MNNSKPSTSSKQLKRLNSLVKSGSVDINDFYSTTINRNGITLQGDWSAELVDKYDRRNYTKEIDNDSVCFRYRGIKSYNDNFLRIVLML